MAEFADVRILAFGVLSQPKTIFLNPNAHNLLNPPGIGRNMRSGNDHQVDLLMKMRTSEPHALEFRSSHVAIVQNTTRHHRDTRG